MPENQISCPGGAASQTGSAVQQRYPASSILNCGKILDVQRLIESGDDGHYVVPLWNSHEGEVPAADYVWNLIEKAKIKISDIWAKQIEFWYLKRRGTVTRWGKIGSVAVAKTQCSSFLKRQQCELTPFDLTTSAHAAYRQGAELDGVLVAPGQGEDEAAFEVVEKQTANPNNFTSFVRVASADLPAPAGPAAVALSGVSMRPLNDYLGDVEQSFFERLFQSAKTIDDVPKLIFVFNRIAKVGLLFEGTRLYAGDLLDAEEIDKGEISIFEEAGTLSQSYSRELGGFIEQEFPDLGSGDFIRHRGVSTCMFACPPLSLYTHGYKAETVEPVVRFYISKLFELFDNGATCTPAQEVFFERHKVSWQLNNSNFMEFENIVDD